MPTVECCILMINYSDPEYRTHFDAGKHSTLEDPDLILSWVPDPDLRHSGCACSNFILLRDLQYFGFYLYGKKTVQYFRLQEFVKETASRNFRRLAFMYLMTLSL